MSAVRLSDRGAGDIARSHLQSLQIWLTSAGYEPVCSLLRAYKDHLKVLEVPYTDSGIIQRDLLGSGLRELSVNYEGSAPISCHITSADSGTSVIFYLVSYFLSRHILSCKITGEYYNPNLQQAGKMKPKKKLKTLDRSD